MRKRSKLAIVSILITMTVSAAVLFGGRSAAFSEPEEERRFDGRVAGEFTYDPAPFVPERRDVSSEFRPFPRAGHGVFAVPTAHSAILVDAESGSVLFKQAADDRRAIASITKLMTVMIAIEETEDLDESATISENSVYAEGTRIGCPRSGYCIGVRLRVGEKISVRNLIRAALMNSANDAAIALAEHVSGSQEKFVERMNRRSKELGLENTRFCTASGLELDDPEAEKNCYSSARDVAKIASYALRYDLIWQTMLVDGVEIFSADGKYSHDIFNTDQMLGYPNLIGTKTGFTPRAGYSLLAVAGDPMNGKRRLIAVVLDDPTRWQSVKDMFSWGFSAYEWR